MHSRFALAVAAVVVAIATIAAISAAPPRQSQTSQAPYLPPGNGVSYPTLVRQETPRYTEQAMRARIEGVVELQAVVLADGTVGEVRVIKSLDQASGLDDEAVTAAKKWVFKPALKDGKPVPVIVTLILEFRLNKNLRPQGESPTVSPGAPAPPEATDDFLNGAYPTKTPGLVTPKLLKNVHPKYSEEAMRAGISGVVEVEVVVLSDGKVGRTRVTKSLDNRYGLDAAALAAVEQWTFEPGKLYGQPVAVAISVALEFRTK